MKDGCGWTKISTADFGIFHFVGVRVRVLFKKGIPVRGGGQYLLGLKTGRYRTLTNIYFVTN